MHVAVPDLDYPHSFLLDKMSKRKEIAGFHTSVIFQSKHNPVADRIPNAE